MNELSYKQRRQTLLQTMKEGMAIIGSGPMRIRSNDTEYPYRPQSDFYYLTGFEEDHAVLIVLKRADETQSVLFVQPKDETMELWTGKRLGVDAAKQRFDVDEVFEISEYETKLSELMLNVPRLYADPFDDEQWFEVARKTASNLRHKRDTKRPVTEIIDVTRLIREQRLVKSEEEIAWLRAGMAITERAHHQAMQIVCPEMMEYELQAHYDHCFTKHGATNAYSTIIAGGNNANTLHYVKNDQPLGDGTLVLVDAGCEYAMYATDITRTYPVGGHFSDAQRRVYEMVLSVQETVIAAIRPGETRKMLQELSEKLLCEAMVELGVLQGDVETLIEEKEHRRYYPHGIGHWLGIDVHDPSPYYDEKGEPVILQAGIVLTIEPGIYLPEDDESIPEAYRGIGIRIEDDVLVTETGYEVLSAGIVKRVEDVEAMCRA